MSRIRRDQDEYRSPFPGFDRPESNWFKMPVDWTNITAGIGNIAEIKVIEYILRHTWGYQEYGLKKHITIDEFVRGRKRQDGSRLDQGTGLSERAVRYGLEKALEDGVIEEEVDESDRGRIKKSYSVRMKEESAPELRDLRPGVQALHLPLQSLPAGGAGSAPRAEKDTLERQPEERNNIVAQSLVDFGVSPPVAERVTRDYPIDYILQKLDLARWLTGKGSASVLKNPAGYLVRAIEDDYLPPPQYKSAEERDTQEKERERRGQEDRERLREVSSSIARAKEAARRKLCDRYPPRAIEGTSFTTQSAWALVLHDMRERVTKANFTAWLRDTYLVSCDQDVAVIAAPTDYQAEWLSKRLNCDIEEALATVLGHPIPCQYLSIGEILSLPSPKGRSAKGVRKDLAATSHPGSGSSDGSGRAGSATAYAHTTQDQS